MVEFNQREYTMGSIEKQEIMNIIDPRRNVGLAKFLALACYGGLSNAFIVFYMNARDAEDFSFLLQRFITGAVVFPTTQILIQLGYCAALRQNANSLAVSGVAGALSALLLNSHDYRLDGEHTFVALITFAAGAMLADYLL